MPNTATTRLGQIARPLAARIERRLLALPFVRRRVQREYDRLMGDLERAVKPYQRDFPAVTRLPEAGRDRAEILAELAALRAREESHWKDGFVSGAVYHGDDDYIEFVDRAYALSSQSNPLHADVWPSATKFEAEIVAMTARMLGAEQAGGGPDQAICGTVSSGGTESILLAMKTYRDQARDTRGITRPEMVVPTTAHAAFEKAAQYFNIKLARVPVGPDYRADVDATRRRSAATRSSWSGRRQRSRTA
jgi:glutamate/tyrosine decarboxylase-like PLP-dependent enzyme